METQRKYLHLIQCDTASIRFSWTCEKCNHKNFVVVDKLIIDKNAQEQNCQKCGVGFFVLDRSDD